MQVSTEVGGGSERGWEGERRGWVARSSMIWPQTHRSGHTRSGGRAGRGGCACRAGDGRDTHRVRGERREDRRRMEWVVFFFAKNNDDWNGGCKQHGLFFSLLFLLPIRFSSTKDVSLGLWIVTSEGVKGSDRTEPTHRLDSTSSVA